MDTSSISEPCRGSSKKLEFRTDDGITALLVSRKSSQPVAQGVYLQSNQEEVGLGCRAIVRIVEVNGYKIGPRANLRDADLSDTDSDS